MPNRYMFVTLYCPQTLTDCVPIKCIELKVHVIEGIEHKSKTLQLFLVVSLVFSLWKYKTIEIFSPDGLQILKFRLLFPVY